MVDTVVLTILFVFIGIMASIIIVDAGLTPMLLSTAACAMLATVSGATYDSAVNGSS